MLLHRDRALSRAALAEAFWPDEDDENARASLRRHLHRALSALPEAPPEIPWVLADKTTLRWNPEAPFELDTLEYERLSTSGEREAAAALYRGDYLEDFYDDWILAERERLREIHAANLVALIEENRKALDYPRAIAYAQALLRCDPLREDAVRRLMSLRFAAGDRSGALAEFETFSRRLRDELATDPMPETLAVHEAIRRNELSERRDDAPPAARPERPAFPFAGREAVLAALRRAWEAAARGFGATIVVSGEAGIGKSRLIGELLAIAEAQGGRIVLGTTAPTEAEPYQPVAEALRGALPLLRFAALDAVKLAALSTLVPEVRDRVPALPRLPDLLPERERPRLFDAIESAFEQLAEKRPLLVVLEDLHWASAATIELVEFVARRLRRHSALVVISFREEEVGATHALRPLLRRIEPQQSNHIALGPLELDDVRTLVAHAVEGDTDTLARGLYSGSEGNPLFVIELLRERLSGAAGEVPAGIAEAVTARIDRLSERARAVVETAAVVGMGFDSETVRHVSGWSFAEVFDALDELLDRALVRESVQRRGDFAFSHHLVHAAVYANVGEDVRPRLHRRVARTLEQLFPERPALAAVIARHFDMAQFEDEAVRHYIPAVRYALAVFAQADAIALATRALEMCREPRDRYELHRLREEAQARAGGSESQRADCRSMREIAEALNDVDLLGTALTRTIMLYMNLGERGEERAAIAALRGLSARASSPNWAVEAALAEARLEINHADRAAGHKILEDVEPLVEALTDDALVVEYWCVRGFASSHFPEIARPMLEKARSRAGASRWLQVRVLRIAMAIADEEGDFEEIPRIANEALGHALEIGDIEGQGYAYQNLALSTWYRFDLASQREYLRLALAAFERVQKPISLASVRVNTGVASQHLGRFEEAEAEYLAGRALADSVEHHGLVVLATANLASLASMRGDHARARRLALEAVALARRHNLKFEKYVALEYLGTAETGLGMFASARRHFEGSLRARRKRDPRGILEVLTEMIPAQLGLGAVDEALAVAEELLRGLEGKRERVTFPASSLHRAAVALAAAGQGTRAATLHTEALALLHDMAARIPDEPSREGYLALALHREVLEWTGEAAISRTPRP